ncbi:class F sortase [Demequina sp. NBRC 110055]|uniref:class F sortase n=1 Tax=Demequina sp. NBRC 110055 TaxID=1570344 RepID=UPI0009FC3FDB|nr:class F sortase [Demequina sp. NBRC 110055]
MTPLRLLTGTAVLAIAASLGWVAVDAWRVDVPPPVSADETTPEARADASASPDTVPSVEVTRAPEGPSPTPDVPGVEAVPGVPARLLVPAIGVDTSLEQLGLQEDGALATPVDTDLAGWFSGGPRPGAVGPAVIAGHVSWRGDPSVFFRLGDIARGDQITVVSDEGQDVTFEVSRVEQHPKDDFPTVAVYANTDQPELRLITCGGDFDRATGHFVDNVIVFARMVDAA